MKDFWGTPALDKGKYNELLKRYKNKVFVSVSNEPFGDEYVLYVCDESDENQAREFLSEYKADMIQRGIKTFAAGVHLGDALMSKKLDGFQGGAFS